MKDSINSSCDGHIVELIPWFVNGTLDSEEYDIVSHHVNSCSECAEILKEEQKLFPAIKQSCMSSNMTEIPANWEEFQSKIHYSNTNNYNGLEEKESDGIDNPIPTNVIRFPVLTRAIQKLKQPKTIAYIVAAQAAALVAVITVPNIFTGPKNPAQSEYTTLSNNEVSANKQIITRQANIIIKLQQDVKIEALDAFFVANEVRIIDTTETGAYLINANNNELEKIIPKLQSNKNIMLAEPISAK